MKKIHLISPTLRAVGVISSVAIVTGGITFAALTSNNVILTGSTIDSATASLKIFNFTADAYQTSAPGFHITGLVPGHGDTEHFYLQNDGGVPLTISATIPNLPGPPTEGYGFSGFENLTVDITGEGCNDPTVHTNMQALNAGTVQLPCTMAAGDAGDSNHAGTSGNYDITFDITPSAITGSQAGVGAFDIQMSGTEAS